MLVHTPTLLLVNLLITATLALCMGLVAQRARRDGLFLWAAALAAHTLGYILLSLRGQVSDVASVVLANGLLSAEFSLYAEGLCQFQQRRPRRWLIWAPAPLVLLTFPFLMDDTLARVIMSAVLLAGQCVVMLWLLLLGRHSTPGRGQYFAMVGFAAGAAALSLRGLSALAGDLQLVSITDSNDIQTLTFLVATVMIPLVCQGLVLMTKERADARNRTLAMEDELTGLCSRSYILEALQQNMARSQHNQHPLAVLIIDIDFFRHVNDNYGQPSGDKALQDLAACVRDRLRAHDLMGRWGGDEFILILPDTDPQGAKHVAEALRRMVEGTRFDAVDGRRMALTVSIGVHALSTVTHQTVDAMTSLADQALGRAKQNGRNRIEQL